MNAPTYQQQFDKLTEVYIGGHVDPNVSCACFVGNILNRCSRWSYSRNLYFIRNNDGSETVLGRLKGREHGHYINDCLIKECGALYTPSDILNLELLFLNTYYLNGGECIEDEINEEALFIAFEKTLDLLRSIHEQKGETINNKPLFTKRQLTV